MNNIVDFSSASASSNRVLDTACDWIAKIDRGLTEDETRAFQTWLYQQPEHMQTMFEVAQFSEQLEQLNRLAQVVPEQLVSKEKSLAWPKAIAASIVLVASAILFTPAFDSSNQYALLEKHYSTQVGEKNTIILPDDSVLVLNTNSKVNIAYSNNARVIELEQGELHIDVSHDLERPLSVVAGDKIIQAVGTAFNVEYSNEDVELLVTDGEVRVADTLDNDDLKNIEKLSSQSLSVTEGHKVSLDASAKELKLSIETVDQSDINKALSWQKGNLVFTGDTLEQAIAEIARYTDLEIELDNDDKLKNMQIAGRFKTGDVDSLLSILATSFNIEHTQLSANKIKLKLKSS